MYTTSTKLVAPKLAVSISSNDDIHRNLYSMIWRTTSWCQIISKRSKNVWNTSQLFRTFPKMFKCFQNRSKQTVIKSAKSLKLENTLVSLKTQIPANTEVKTQCHRNRIQWNTVHSRTFSAHQKCRVSMNTEVKCSIIEASSNELLYQIEVHNGLIPAYIVKKHDGPIPYIHTPFRRAASKPKTTHPTRKVFSV